MKKILLPGMYLLSVPSTSHLYTLILNIPELQESVNVNVINPNKELWILISEPV